MTAAFLLQPVILFFLLGAMAERAENSGAQGERRLLDAEATEIVGAGAFHEMQVAGVIDGAGEVGVFIVDALGQVMTICSQPAGERYFHRRHCRPWSCMGGHCLVPGPVILSAGA